MRWDRFRTRLGPSVPVCGKTDHRCSWHCLPRRSSHFHLPAQSLRHRGMRVRHNIRPPCSILVPRRKFRSCICTFSREIFHPLNSLWALRGISFASTPHFECSRILLVCSRRFCRRRMPSARAWSVQEHWRSGKGWWIGRRHRAWIVGCRTI